VDRVGLLLEDEALAPQVVGCQSLLDLIAACLGCLRGDRSFVSHGGGSSHPAAGEPRLPLRVHRVLAELELFPGQHLLLQTEHKHGGGEHRKAEELLRWVRP
jgi:hypothetical protein